MRYFKLGKKAESYYDSVSKLKVSKNKPGTLEDGANSKRVDVAANAGHLNEITEAEYDQIIDAAEDSNSKQEASDALPDFDKMTKAQLLAYIEENYTGVEEELKSLKDAKKADIIAFIIAQEN